MARRVKQYVAYTPGLLATNDEDNNGLAIGADVSPEDFEPDEWNYHVQHGNVVPKGGEHDPNVLAARNEADEEDDEPLDPRDQEIAELRAQLRLYQGRNQTPPPGTFHGGLEDEMPENDEVGDEDAVGDEDVVDDDELAGPQA